MRPPFALRATAATTALALTLAACSGSADDGGGTTTSSSSSSSATSSSSSTTGQEVEISGAPTSLTRAVATKYGSHSIKGTATTGTWRGAKVAVVTAEDDVTLAVRPKNRERWKVVGGWWPSLGKKGKADLGGNRHVLVIGSDARPGEKVQQARADAIQLLGVDGKGGAGLMGIARDLWVPIPGHGHGKLNSSMVFSGASGQAESVSRVSGIDVDGYVVTGFEGFMEIVNEVGPLDFDAPKKLESHLGGGKIPKGESRLSGREALAWSRERKTLPGGDFDRSHNQGLLLVAAAVQARLRGPDSLPEALSVIDKNASSNLSAEDMLLFTAAFYRVKPSQVGHEVAKGPTGMQSGQSIVRLGSDSKAAFRDFRDGRLS